MGTLATVTGLQKIWIAEQGMWILVWSCCDGDLDVNHRICYCVVSSPAEFHPENGQFILAASSADGDKPTFAFVYGVPYALESAQGIVKVYYHDLNCALGWPRQATGEEDSTDITGKDPVQGFALEGHFMIGNLTQGPILWGIKKGTCHNNASPVLEVTDIGDKNFSEGSMGSGDTGYSAPTGTMLVEYQRDNCGRVKIDDDGKPLFAQIDDSAGDTAQNFKIGYLGLTFKKDYYGMGIHGWIGSAAKVETPFLVIDIGADDNGDPQCGVISNSHVVNIPDKDSYEVLNDGWGLLADDVTSSDPNAIPVNSLWPGDKIWISFHFDDQGNLLTKDTCINYGPVGTQSDSEENVQWEKYPDPVEFNVDENPYQKYYHQIIAEVTDPEQDPRPGIFFSHTGDKTPDGQMLDRQQDIQITQLLFTNLSLVNAHTTEEADVPGLPIMVVLPYNYPGTNIDGSAEEINEETADIKTPWEFGIADPKLTPFQVIKVIGGNIGVNPNSHLFNSSDKDVYEIANNDWGLLLNNYQKNDTNSINPNNLEVGDKIWLQITFTADNNITDISIESGPDDKSDSPWERFPDPIFIDTTNPDEAYQKYYYQVIAEVTDPEQDPRPGMVITKTKDNTGTEDELGNDIQITQLLFTNLLLTNAWTTEDADQPNLPIKVAIPWNGPVTSANGSSEEINEESDIVTPWQFSGLGQEEFFPFKVITRTETNESGDPIYYYGVIYHSLLLISSSYTENQTISGLLSSDTPSNDDEGWILWNVSEDIVWLELDVSDFSVTGASITSWSTGNDFGGGEVENDGGLPPNQSKARIVIAKITVGNDGEPIIDQRVRTHLQMVPSIEDSKDESGGNEQKLNCIVPVAFPGEEAVPDWLQTYGDDENGFTVVLGEGEGSFVNTDSLPAQIREFELKAGDEDSGMYFHWLLGDETDSNDIFFWQHYNDSYANGIRMSVYDYPQLVLTDQADEPDNNNTAKLDVANGPELDLRDDDNNLIRIDINADPELLMTDDRIEEFSSNYIYATLSDTDPRIIVATSDYGFGVHASYLNIHLDADNDVFLGLDENTGDHKLTITKDSDAVELYPTYLQFGDGSNCFLGESSVEGGSSIWKLFIKDEVDVGDNTTLTDGTLDMSEASDASVELGSGGAVNFGDDSHLRNNDLTLGDGSITIDGYTFTSRTISYMGPDGHSYSQQILADEETDEGDALTGMVKDIVTDILQNHTTMHGDCAEGGGIDITISVT